MYKAAVRFVHRGVIYAKGEDVPEEVAERVGAHVLAGDGDLEGDLSDDATDPTFAEFEPSWGVDLTTDWIVAPEEAADQAVRAAHVKAIEEGRDKPRSGVMAVVNDILGEDD